MFKKVLYTIAVVLATSIQIFGQSGTLKGKITDNETKEPVPFANVVMEAGGRQVSGTTTDFDGNFTIKPIPPGKYNVKTSYVGYQPQQLNGVVINSDKITFVEMKLTKTAVNIKEVVVTDYKVPLISKDETASGETATSEQISKMAGRDANSVVATVGGVIESGDVRSIRGARGDATVTYIDGVKVSGGSTLPVQSIEQVSVITGGLPAQYGDATGGVINITTKGPSRQWGGGVELVTSEIIDKTGYNSVNFSLQGPLLKNKAKTSSLLGFFIAGDVTTAADENPSYIGIWKAKKSVLDRIEKNPVFFSIKNEQLQPFMNSEFLTKDSLEKVKYRENAGVQRYSLSGKVDIKTTNNTNLTFGGRFELNRWRIVNYNNNMMNSENNGLAKNYTYAFYGKFTQRFANTDTSKAKKKALIKNVYYTIQADYSKFNYGDESYKHKDRLFDYGYLGKFKTTKEKNYAWGKDTITGLTGWLGIGEQDVLYTFERSEINSDLANYTQFFYDYFPPGTFTMKEAVQFFRGGLLNGAQPPSVYDLWNNTGFQYNTYDYGNTDQISVNASGSADIKNHAITLGFLYEQRTYRAWSTNPVGLWTLMRQLANKHIIQLDKNNPHPVYDETGLIFLDTINYDHIYDATSQSFFDYNLRKKLELSTTGTDWIDVDSYDPNTYSIDMFNADELLNNGNRYVAYRGYDYKGDILKNNPTLDDFFTAKDQYGNYKREIAPYQPIYTAGFIQDKFAFNDLVFNIGMRLDRFDANQKVLKDQYLLYEAKTKKEVNDLGTHPASIGDDYVVYVDNAKTPTSIMGYRNGSTWYNKDGAVIQDPAILFSNGLINPYLVDPEQIEVNSKAFKDYEPQINFMPRIAFSFPISDEALFFAHYDELTKRPNQGQTSLSPTQYLFIYNMGGVVLNNPDLKPERTIDYELGFQQKISNTSSLKISTYYRELRNMIQATNLYGAYPVSYMTYTNIDFGTVKGITLTYDLRRTGNVWLKASYTLQFADGTGSNATTGQSLVSSGLPNLRNLQPLDYDRRHNISIVIDYRYGTGKEYNGPKITKKIKGTDKTKTILLLQNTGANFTVNWASGTPYSKQSQITEEASLTGSGRTPSLKGMINGARMPSQTRIDARIDKDIDLKPMKGGKQLYVNVYVVVTNILNIKNITQVYRATGIPDDDGYLTAPEYQQSIEDSYNPLSFRDYYSVKVDSPYNYGTPRLVRVGVSLNF
ncbi:MAG: carboxypeptidase-like regulatory domain-containing protein [Bacteroidales bacterium]|nr:carboxypeptidase-like regulatory domain-containing protein [Bacteroidales bacterium]